MVAKLREYYADPAVVSSRGSVPRAAGSERRSAWHLKKTWGEQIIGNLSIGLAFTLISIVGVLIAAGAIALAAQTKSVVLVIATVGLFLSLAIALGLIGSALSGIYTAAVYRYAAEGDAGTAFDPELVRNAFRRK